MQRFPSFLAASDLMHHVQDAPLFEGWIREGTSLHRLVDALYTFGMTKHVFLFVVAGLLTILFFWSYARQLERRPGAVPGRWGNFVETLIEFLRNHVTRPFLGEAGDKYLPLVVTFFVYILIANLMGLVPLFYIVGEGGNTSTANYLITAGLAICSFSLYHYLGVREQGGVWRYVKSLFPHVPLFVLPLIVAIELVAHLIRPAALAIRLFANMTAGHIMIAAILGFTITFTEEFFVGGGVISLVSVVAVTLLTFLELLVAVIQAFVFTFLTTVFLSLAVHPEH